MESHIKTAKQRVRRIVTRTAGPTVWNVLNNNALLIFRVSSVLIYYIIGAAYYHAKEGWTVIDSVYFVTVSVATIGYGYLVPTTDSSRVFTSFFVIAGLIFVLTAADDFAVHVVVRLQNNIINSYYPRITDLDRAAKKLSMTFACLVALSFLCIIFFITNEEWSGASAFYWTVSTMTTVGYGDLNLKYESTRIFSIFFIAFCVISYATVIHNIQEVYAAAIQPSQQHMIEVPSLSSRFRERRPQFDAGIDPESMGVPTLNPLVQMHSTFKYRRAAQNSGHSSSNMDDFHDPEAVIDETIEIDDEDGDGDGDGDNGYAAHSPVQESKSAAVGFSSFGGDACVVSDSELIVDSLRRKFVAGHDATTHMQPSSSDKSGTTSTARSLRRYYSLRGTSRTDVFSPMKTHCKTSISPVPHGSANGASPPLTGRSLAKSQSFIGSRQAAAGKHKRYLELMRNVGIKLKAVPLSTQESTADCTLLALSVLQQLHEGSDFATSISKLIETYSEAYATSDRLRMPVEEFAFMMCEYHKAAASNNEFEPAAETKQAIDDTSRVASGNSISSRLQHDPLPFEINLDHAFKCADDNGFNGKAIAHQTDEGHDVTLLSSSFDVAQQLDTLDCSSACGPTPSPTADSRTFPVSTITMNSATDPIIDDNDFTSL